MITTQTIKLKKPGAKQFSATCSANVVCQPVAALSTLDNLWIENEFSKMGFNVIRWAIIDISETEILLTVSVQD